MKQPIKNLISVICVLALLTGGIMAMSQLTGRKDSAERYDPFYDTQEAYDVLFFGNSRMVNAIYPLELWKDYGIASYNLAAYGLRIPASYWELRVALEHTTPQLVVFCVSTIETNEKIQANESQVHDALDALPLSRVKLAAIFDLFDNWDKRLEHLFLFSIYHERWEELSADDFAPPLNVEKGAVSMIGVTEAYSNILIDKDEVMAASTVGVEYLGRAIEECQSRGIDILLFYPVCYVTEENQRGFNTVYEIARRYGVDYLNCVHWEQPIVDFAIDFYDQNHHLNCSGARKQTALLGAYLTEHYALTDHRGDSAYDHWDKDYAVYTAFKHHNLQAQTTLNPYLMLLYDRGLRSEITVNRSLITSSVTVEKLLRNLGATPLPAGGHDAAYRLTTENRGTLVAEAMVPATADPVAATITVWDADTGLLVDEARFDTAGNRIVAP